MKTPKEMIQDILEENVKLRQEYHNIEKKITRIADKDVFACVKDLIKERSVEILPKYIEPIFSESCSGGCCVSPSQKWDPSIGCYKYKDLRTGKIIDLYFNEEEDVNQEDIEHLKKLCEKLTEEVGIEFYIWTGKEEEEE